MQTDRSEDRDGVLQPSPIPAAREAYLNGDFSACFSLLDQASAGSPAERREALLLRARALLRQHRSEDVIALLGPVLPGFVGVDEACTNVIRYAYAMRDDQPIRLSIERLRDCVRIRLRDYGEPIYKSLNALGSATPKAGGRGIQLMRHIFDKVEYSYKPRGTELVLTRCWRRAS